jgi:hypothetical protein
VSEKLSQEKTNTVAMQIHEAIKKSKEIIFPKGYKVYSIRHREEVLLISCSNY